MRRRAAIVLLLLAAAAATVAPAAASEGLAVDDTYSTNEDAALTLAADAGLLANDTGGSAVLCVLSVDTTDLRGSVDLGGLTDGSFTYSPPANFNGTTTFTYEVANLAGGTCPSASVGSAQVTITVDPVNDPPNAVADFFSALTDRTLNIAAPGVLANDSDVDGDALTAHRVAGGGPAHGTLTLGDDGGFSYTPDAGYVGPDAFAYRASDGTDQSAARVVNINVSALPPSPSPAPVVTPTPVPPSPTPEPSPTGSPQPSDSGLASPSPTDTGLGASASASAGPATGPVSNGGGPPILAIGALALLLGLLAVAAVFFVRGQRGGTEAHETGYGAGAYEAGAYDTGPYSSGATPNDLADDDDATEDDPPGGPAR